MPVPQVPMSVRGKKACSYTGGAHVKWSPLRQVQKLCFFVKKYFFKFCFDFYVYALMCLCTAGEYLKTPSRVSSPLGLELQAVASHLT